MSHDLTGQVVKKEAYCFISSRRSDIWTGMLDNVVVAVKVPRGLADHSSHKRVLREMKVWNSVNQPNIVPLLGVSFDFDRPNTPCLISPYYRHGNIIDYLLGNQNVDILPLIAQIAGALLYLHTQSIIHGDIKGSNIVIDDNGRALLTDFGRSRILGVSGLTTMLESVMSYMAPVLMPLSFEEEASDLTTYEWRWMAPELLAVEEESIPHVTAATDVYSFAMTAIEIITQRVPFWHIRVDASVVVYVVSGGRPKREYYQQINDDIWCTLEECWSAEPSRRPSMDVLLSFFGKQLTSLTAERAHL